MTDLERDIRIFIMRAMLRASGPVPDATLRQMITNGFPYIAFDDDDLKEHIQTAENLDLIASGEDALIGKMWDLTTRGKIQAERLG